MMQLSRIKEVLGKPYYENDYSLIYNMDCNDGLRQLQNSSIKINATITSPPYNIGKEYEKIIPIDEFVKWLSKIDDLIYRITDDNGAYMLNVGYLSVNGKGRSVPIAYLLWGKSNFFMNQEIVWNYGAGVSSKNYLSPRNEKIIWYVKNAESFTFNLDDIRDPDVKYPLQKKNGKLRCNTLGKNPSDVWQIAKVTSGFNRASEERTNHPAQFPTDLIQRLVLGFSNPGDIILDPFMGSGTTAEVCMLNNRYSLGFEIRSDYCKIISQRLDRILVSENTKKTVQTLF